MKQVQLNNSQYYENREQSWLEFNQRVLDEAENNENPLFERLKFLSIVSSNLDEFFMVRVASLKEQVNVDYEKEDFSGLAPKEILKNISERIHRMMDEQAHHFKKTLIPLLKKEGIFIKEIEQLTPIENEFLEDYFTDILYPVLTPLAVDSSRPFPLILNKSLNIAALLCKNNEEVFATVQVPAVLPRYVKIPSKQDGVTNYILMENIIIKFIQRLFVGHDVRCAFPFRITRNADLSIDEEEAHDLLLEIEKSIKKRKWGEAIRLEVQHDMDEELVKILIESLNMFKKDVYYIDAPLDFTFLMKVYSLKGYDKLKFKPYEPKIPKDLLGEEDIFEVISRKDVFLSHPYESFEPVIDFIKKAAKDKRVLAIKQTLYRVSGQSPIVRALAEAAEAGKQVTVLVELKARFDEENNIQWARKLEESGCHVIYGLVGLKTHSKVTLVVRKEEGSIKRYIHLGTGNYNDITARFYTDMGLFTCNEKIGADVSAIFNTLSGYSDPPKLHKIILAPTGLRKAFNNFVEREIELAKEGKEAKIIAKMNALCDAELIELLYKASVAGVKIELIIRGICCLIPGIPNVSENITVKSIVGKYLEHSRIFYFLNNGQEEIYLSSADWMPRNLNRRVELLFPIEDQRIKERIKNELNILLSDIVKSKIKDLSNAYHRIDRRGKTIVNAQELFEDLATKAEKDYTQEKELEMFIPIKSDKKLLDK
ncbi:MAG: RNA degradosome polyphosphate kinase [Firmicutes bacterium HGW-Firmicutes-1]|jgi:polyphosphate kinase|nr:MAG: RNA degradosome polyphosphate kinase [Firmicutes bacterium HGW-Firmicutes-1]